MIYNPTDTGVEVETERRLTLLRHGFDPLPLVPPPDAQLKGDLLGSKAVLLKGWPKLDFTARDVHRTIQGWRSVHGHFEGEPVPSMTTGIRFPTAIDLDIDHAHIDQVLDALAHDPELRHSLGADWFSRCPVRTGGGQKLCIIANRTVRVGKGKIVGRSWQSPDEETMGHVEVFHGQGQVGASGVHSYRVVTQPQGFFAPKPVFTPAILYNYLEGPTPFDVRLEALPMLSPDDLARVQAVVEGTLSELGWALLDFENRRGGGQWSYTLRTDDDMVFDTQSGERTYGQLYPGLRVAMHTITGQGHDRSRGWIFQVMRDGELFTGVHDHKSDIRYLPPEARPLTSKERELRATAKANALLAYLAGKNRPTTHRPTRERISPVTANENEKNDQ